MEVLWTPEGTSEHGLDPSFSDELFLPPSHCHHQQYSTSIVCSDTEASIQSPVKLTKMLPLRLKPSPVKPSAELRRPTDTTSNSSARCLLLDLPTELRLQILEHLFEHWKDHFHHEKPAGLDFYQHGVIRLLGDRESGRILPFQQIVRPGILFSCKQLRREAMDVLYDKTLFFYLINRPNDGHIRPEGSILDGPVQNLELLIRIYHTQELQNSIHQLVSILNVIPEKRKRTAVRIWLHAFQNYARLRRDEAFPPEESDQAWLAISRLLRLELGCEIQFSVGSSWQRALGPARMEQLKQKANVLIQPLPLF